MIRNGCIKIVLSLLMTGLREGVQKLIYGGDGGEGGDGGDGGDGGVVGQRLFAFFLKILFR